jgi:hypothetical protein
MLKQFSGQFKAIRIALPRASIAGDPEQRFLCFIGANLCLLRRC